MKSIAGTVDQRTGFQLIMAPLCSKGTTVIISTLLLMLDTVPSVLLGGYKKVDVNDKAVRKYADYAVDELNAEMNNYHYFKRSKILEASYQVVNGLNYYLKIELSPTTCVKSGEPPVSLETCQLLKNSAEKPQICKVHIWVRLWLNQWTMTDYQCTVEEN
ncbi:Cystatin [Holothuria leucospilota]|uniref:Cystatin n=1 Tax=Holothuria leucospilota TaxID=206669 RepID=A0A9Q1HG71_HOLLE|nr:Cystatin [Holothuria leucospilota]